MGRLRSGDRMECPHGYEYGHADFTGPITCQFGCYLYFGKVKVFLGKNKPSLHVNLQVKIQARSNLKGMDATYTDPDGEKERPSVYFVHTNQTVR